MSEAMNRRILVVDDNPEIHRDFGKVLSQPVEDSELEAMEEAFFGKAQGPHRPAVARQSYHLESAFQGEEALGKVLERLARREPYAVAFVDMRMPPGWDGVETIRELWRVDPDLQVVICTAHSDYSWEEILGRLGSSDRLLILKKPFDAVEVCQLACALTEKWHLGRQARLRVDQLRAMVEEQTHELRTSEARYALAAAGAHDGIWDWDLIGGTVYFSKRWKSVLGYADAEVGGEPDEWLGRVHPDDLPALKEAIDAHACGASEHLESEYRMRHKDGQHRWMSCRALAVRDGAGRATRIAGSQTDITDRHHAEERLRHDALHDALTGLANRSLLLDRIQQCLLRSRRDPERRFAVLFGDLDRFKLINDSLGHIAGDLLLVDLSKRLLQCVRATDSVSQIDKSTSVARLGGDEFVVLLDGLRGASDALRVARRLQEALADPFLIEGKEVFTGMSMGIALGRPEYERAEDILRDADTALYQAKVNGRGGCEFFDSGMRTSAMARWWLENGLRRAVDRNELRLVYQPVVSVGSGELREFEALLRWQHPERGPISPAEFIPVAEETGLIVSIGEWVVKTAIEQLARWQEHLPGRPHFSVAVNVSGLQLSRADLVDFVSRELAEKKVPIERLRLEVTESALMRKDSATMLTRMADLGLMLHLDDFGTGYSSLSYLHQLPVDALKIDRSFVNDMVKNDSGASIVATIIALAHALGANVIAEGVETKEQLDQLRRLACDWAQGYYFSRPLEVEQATALLAPPAPSVFAAAAAPARPAER